MMQMMHGYSILLLLALLAVSSIGVSLAKDSDAKPTVKQVLEASEKSAKIEKNIIEISRDPLGRDTPLSTFHSFAKALDERDFKHAVDYMDMRNLPLNLRDRGEELAREIKIIGDTNIWVDPDTLSNNPEGHKDDGQPHYRDLLTRIKTPEGSVYILLQRVPDGKGNKIWKLSNSTVAEIPKLYKYYGYGKLGG